MFFRVQVLQDPGPGSGVQVQGLVQSPEHCPVRDNALQMQFSRTSLPIDAGTGFISSDSQ